MPSCILTWVSLATQAASDAAPALSQPWGLPPGHSTIAPDVDFLYTLILWITGIVFIGVEGLIVYFCIKYRGRPGGKPGYTHGNNTAEIIWTVSPAIVLVAIALLQMPTWAKAKISPPKSTDTDVVTIQTFAHQFSWHFRYPGADGNFDTKDDLITPEKLVWLPVGSTALMPIRSIDVIHSFFLFQMRVKQDVVPGLRNSVWFKPTGFYLAPIKKDMQEFYAQEKFNTNWVPKNTHMKWEGEYKWMFVRGEEEFREKYGTKVVVPGRPHAAHPRGHQFRRPPEWPDPDRRALARGRLRRRALRGNLCGTVRAEPLQDGVPDVRPSEGRVRSLPGQWNGAV